VQFVSRLETLEGRCLFSAGSVGFTDGAIGPIMEVYDPQIAAKGGVDVGVKFQSDTSGTVSGVKFWKGAGDTGTHIGQLWSSDGTLLASATFTNETASGTQDVTFSTPVAISANTTYVVSYHTTNAAIAYTPEGQTDQMSSSGLHALASSTSGGNGVYLYDNAGKAGFPDVYNGQAPTYWVDVDFTSSAGAPASSPPPSLPTPPPSGHGPSAVITQLQSSIIAGEGVEVNALNSTAGVGSPLTTIYKWDFGDPGSQYNNLLGWNAAHVYTSPGTYTITLQLTDSSGNTSTATSQVTVNIDNRTIIYVDTNGSDSNNGLSASQPVKTANKAFSLAGSDSTVLFHRGETFNVTSTLWFTGHDEAAGAYGTGSSPVLMWVPNDGSLVEVYVSSKASNSTIENLTFDTPNAVTSGAANDIDNAFAIFAGGTNVVVLGNTFDNVEDAVNGGEQPTGVIVQDNSAPLLKGMRGYLCWVDGNNWTILGNTVANTTRAHCIRVNGSDVVGVLIADNNLTKQYPSDDPGEDYKTTIDVRIGSYVYVADNILNDSTVAVSPSPGQTVDQTANWIVFDGNTINNAQLVIDEVGHHIMVRNNVLNISGTGQIVITPSGTTVPGALMTDITISHNTGINTGQDGELIDVLSEPAPGSITIDHNLYSAPNLRYGYGWDSAVYLNTPDMTGFASITDNIWPTANNLNIANVVNFLTGAGTGAGYLTQQGWNSLPAVSDDQYSDTALPSGSYQLTLNGVTAGAATVVL
jgi:hypothetical protein